MALKEKPGTGSENVTEIRLDGSVDESLEFLSKLKGLKGHVTINCKEIHRINSAGVRGWARAFAEVRKQVSTLRFEQCSPQLVQAASMVSDILRPNEVVSLYCEFTCMKCRNNEPLLFTMSQLQAEKFNPKPRKCKKCGGNMEFDDIPSDYFKFLKAQS